MITGIPDAQLYKFSTRNPEALKQHTIINNFVGYNKYYFLGGSPEFNNPYLLKDHLHSIARSALPRRMGTKFAQVVETCLTCLDPENTDFGDERDFQDADGILVGVRYIEKVGITSLAM